MKTRIYASSVVGLWAALRLRNLGCQIELYYLKKESETLRPARIARATLAPMIEQLSRLGIPATCLLEAPVVRGWMAPTGERFERLWSERASSEERWVDMAALKQVLVRACELEGIFFKEVEIFPTPEWGHFDYLGIYEAPAAEASHWTKAFQSPTERELYEVTEVFFPRAMDSALQRIIFFEFDGAKGVLENLNRQKSVLTVSSRSRILIDQVFDDLRTRLSEREHGALRALFALNPHIFRRDSKVDIGESGLYIPQFCLLGTGLGVLPVLTHTQIREGLKQVGRLEERVERLLQAEKGPHSDFIRVAEEWYRSERKGFLRLLSWQKLWEASLWSRLRQTWTLRFHQYLPGMLRDLLRSPL